MTVTLVFYQDGYARCCVNQSLLSLCQSIGSLVQHTANCRLAEQLEHCNVNALPTARIADAPDNMFTCLRAPAVPMHELFPVLTGVGCILQCTAAMLHVTEKIDLQPHLLKTSCIAINTHAETDSS